MANSIATLVEFVVLLVLIRRRMGGFQGRRMMRTLLKSGLAALIMGIALLGWQVALPTAGALIRGAGGIILGLGVYLAAALLLQCDELHALVRLARRR